MDDLWQRITLAFLHDPPCKVYDVGKSHEEIARGFIRNCCTDMPLNWESYWTLTKGDNPDWAAAASDRIIFPRAKFCAEKFAGMIRHPLSGAHLKLDLPPSQAVAIELLQNSLGGIHATTWKDFFFLLWRRWREGVTLADSPQQNGPALAVFPADTRLPDHSIWEHMNLTAAFEACRSQETEKIAPAFLLFQLGPVQDFIAAARKTRDLWSGSYLLSFMMAQAMKAVCDEVGPSAVIFPNLCGQGVFDLANKDIFDRIVYAAGDDNETLWHRIYGTEGNAPDQEKNNEAFERLWAPTLPNRFLALVPADRAEKLTRIAEEAIQKHWRAICNHCFSRLCAENNEVEYWRQRWEKQTENFWQITCQTMPFFATADEAIEKLSDYPDGELKKTLSSLYHIATEQMPKNDRDERNYANSACTKLSRAEFAWSLNVAEAFKALAARRNTREFAQFLTDDMQEGSPKDALTGKEEVIGPESMWKKAFLNFKENESPYGAITIVKRLWSSGKDCYLTSLLDESQRNRFTEVRSIPSTEEVAKNNQKSRNYIAILAMDGDAMGKWMNGDNAPRLIDLLEKAPRNYFEENIPDYQSLKRPLSPGYHAQFSEMLTNFTSRIAGKVVEKYNGTLIYAGGDDVLAMVPMDQALPCAWALRELFQGRVPQKFQDVWSATDVNGFLRELGKNGCPGAYLTVPGSRADVSCGIAIGHMHYPLQHLVNEALEAEHRAKACYERGAVAVSALKRSGEILHWGAKWDSNANSLLDHFTDLMDDNVRIISKRFAYAFAGLCAPYEPGKIAYADEAMREVIAMEFNHVCNQQTQQTRDEVKAFQAQALAYFDFEVETYAPKESKVFCDNFINLFLLASFISRSGEEDK